MGGTYDSRAARRKSNATGSGLEREESLKLPSMQRSHSDSSRAGTSRSVSGRDGGVSSVQAPPSPRRQKGRMGRAVTVGGVPTVPRADSVTHHRTAVDVNNTSTNSGYCWWAPEAARPRTALMEGWMKKRGGRINNWPDRYYVLRERSLEQYGKGEDASKPSAEPKHEYHFDAGCSVSEIKEVRAGGKTIFSFQLNWPQLQNVKEETEAETEGGYNRPGNEEDSGDSEAAHPSNGSPSSDIPTPLDSPVDLKNRRAGGVMYGPDDGDGPMPSGSPTMHRVSSNGSLQLNNATSVPTGPQHEVRSRRTPSSTNIGAPAAVGGGATPGQNTRHVGHNGVGMNSICISSGASTVASPALVSSRKLGCDEECRNETIEHMVAAQREDERRRALLQQEELEQLTEYEQVKGRRQDKQRKKEKKAATTRGQAVAVTAVGVSWLTAGIATGGLVLAGGLVVAGVTMGSMGVYHKYKNKNPGGPPSRVRLASDKFETAEQWRNAIRDQLEKLQALQQQTQRELDLTTQGSSMWMGQRLGELGIPSWTTQPPPTMPPPALKAIDLRVVNEMLGNAAWMSREVIQGLAILEQDLSATATATAGADAGEGRIGFGTPGGKGKEDRGAAGGWGLGGVGPVLKTQTIVRASPLETFVALMGAPRNSMNAVVSGIISVQCMDDHSDVVRLCARPVWLKMAWAAPRDFCLARYWHRAEDGCYIVCLSSMEHPLCPVYPGYVRGDVNAVYTISPRRDSLPGAAAHPECLLACHAQVDPKGWVWSGLGFRERYTSNFLMHVLEVRNVIEAERFIEARISFRPDSKFSSANASNALGSVAPRSTEDGGPLLFEVLGAPGSKAPEEECPYPSAVCQDGDGQYTLDQQDRVRVRGSTSLENDPPPTLDARMWAEVDGREFSVRGGSYLTNRLKVQSAKQMFRLRAVDMFVLPQPATHIASHPSNRVQIARQKGETAFVWVLQIMVPGPPHYAFMCYFTPENPSNDWLDSSTPFGNLAERVFFGKDDDFRDQRLKLIPKIVEGNWVVKRAAGSTPAILGTKLKQHHFRGNNYLETDLEIGSSSVAASITRLCTGYAKSLVVDMVWTIQGNIAEELPEIVLAGVRIHHLDMLSAKPFDPSAAL